jgi:hypothetical protein
MRQLPGPLLASVALALSVVVVVTGGSYVVARSDTTEVTFDTDIAMPPEPDGLPDAADGSEAASEDGVAATPDADAGPRDELAPEPDPQDGATQSVEVPAPPALPHRTPADSRPVAPDIIAQPETGAEALQWEAPREPLSQLSLALPPKPKPMKDPVLFRPVAVESAVVEAMGRRVVIAGAESIALDETCVAADGTPWPCGVSARTAFRLWLRGRALTCDLPENTEIDPIVAACRMGTQDAGAWLVANGWARAAAGGPYAEAQKAAERAGKGIFGAAPDRSNLPSLPDAGLQHSEVPASLVPDASPDVREPDGFAPDGFPGPDGLGADDAAPVDPRLSTFPPAPPQ